MSGEGTTLVTGASGFIGRHLVTALRAAGRPVRCGSRNPGRARASAPDCEWVELELSSPLELERALSGCDVAYYLVHSVGERDDYDERERTAAERFARTAHAAGVRRVVYLGGVAPRGVPSRHLRSRLRTGEILRAGPSSAVELRAAMVVGPGSASFRMVRDLAARLPAMVLPRWLAFRSMPVGLVDVVGALVRAGSSDIEPGWYDLPGPEVVSHREVLRRVAALLGRRPPMFDVPVLTPRLSSWWIRLVTGVDPALARELVDGLASDLVPLGERDFWAASGGAPAWPLERAAESALAFDRGDAAARAALSAALAAAGVANSAAPTERAADAAGQVPA